MTLKKAPVQKEGADQSLTPQDKTDIKTELDLQNVDNTSDLNKPISTAQQTALDNKVDTVAGKGLAYPDAHLVDLSFSGTFDVDVRTFSSYRLNLTGNSNIFFLFGSSLPNSTSKVINLIVTSDTQTETFGIPSNFNQYGTYDPTVRNMLTISITKDASGNLEHDVFINQPD